MQLERPGWRSPPHTLVIANDQVHLWRATLDWPEEQAARLQQWLSADERERMERFRSGRDRHRYLVGRGLLRTVIGRYLAVSPGVLRFDTIAAGKPRLALGVAPQPLQFNLSHSGDLVLIALASGRALGVDVEQVRADLEAAEIAARFFSPTEQQALATLSGARQIDAFFDCWVRKEAYVKARGDGLSLPLEQFDVSLLPGEAAQLIETRPDPAEASRWRLTALDAGDGYKAALVVEGDGWMLQQWDWASACPATR
jgi:4'-phosphopantetheinyl transferase